MISWPHQTPKRQESRLQAFGYAHLGIAGPKLGFLGSWILGDSWELLGWQRVQGQDGHALSFLSVTFPPSFSTCVMSSTSVSISRKSEAVQKLLAAPGVQVGVWLVATSPRQLPQQDALDGHSTEPPKCATTPFLAFGKCFATSWSVVNFRVSCCQSGI